MTQRDLIIVGAGPTGLAAAIAARRGGLDALVLERGALVNTILHYPTNMVFFTTPELLEVGGLPFVTPHEKPTRVEALRYYRRVADACALEIEFDEEVIAIYPEERSPAPSGFVVETRSRRGVRRGLHTRFVVVATGAFDRPNLINVPGEDLPHVSHYYTEAHPYFRKRVVIVGGQNSAADAALDLYRSGAHVTLVHRRSQLGASIKYWVKPDIENRIREGAIAARFDARVVEIRPTETVIERPDGREELPADAVFLLTGYHCETAIFERAGIEFDPVSFKPEFHPDTLETNVPGIFVAGSVITGKQSGRIFIENGRFHGDQVVDTIRRRVLAGASLGGDRTGAKLSES